MILIDIFISDQGSSWFVTERGEDQRKSRGRREVREEEEG